MIILYDKATGKIEQLVEAKGESLIVGSYEPLGSLETPDYVTFTSHYVDLATGLLVKGPHPDTM
jgi:hypothetical protein